MSGAQNIPHAPKVPDNWITPTANVDGKLDELGAGGAMFEGVDDVTETEIVNKTTLPLTQVTNTDTDVYSLSSNTVTLSKPGRYYWTVRATAAGTAAGGAWGAELVVRVDSSVRANSKCHVSRSA